MSLPIPEPTNEVSLHALKALIRERTILAAMEAFHQKMGNIFRITVPGFNPVMLVGPDAAHFVLVESRGDLRWRPEGDPVARLLRQGVLVIDGEAHDTVRRQMNPALHKRMLGGYVETMWRCTDQVTARWTGGQTYDMLVEMRRAALMILTQTLFKVDSSPDIDRLWQSILKILQYISPGLWILWPGIPRPGQKRAQQQINDYLYQMIRTRRAAMGEPGDLLGLLATTPGMDDGLIRDQLLTMLIAGHDTSTALLSWALYLLGKHPDVMQKAREEVNSVIGSEAPNIERLGDLRYLGQVIDETLRLYPPIHLGMRIAAQDLDFQGYTIPAGTRVMYSIYLTHRMKEHWDDPACFNPDRFSPAHNKDRTPYSYLPFGGGPRNCIGSAFAQVETKVVLARLLQRYHFKLLPQKVHAHMGATLEPRPGVFMQVCPHQA